MVGGMTGEQFQAAMSQRPLRIRVLPPNSSVWQQVANFQKQVVRLSFQKVLLQKALRDEHENVKKELGMDSDVDAKQKARASFARADMAGQRKQLERRKQEASKQEADLETKREQVAAFDKETQSRRKALDDDRVHLASRQADLERARHDFDAIRKARLEELEKERQLLAAERAELEAKRDEVLVAQTEREDLETDLQRLREEQGHIAAQKAELESAIQKAQADLQEERSALLRQREELEDDVEGMAQAKSELQAQRSRGAEMQEELEKEALAFKEACDATKEQLVTEREQLREQLQQQQLQLQKEKEDFKTKCKQALQQIEARKRQLLQLQKQLAAQKSVMEQARKDLEEPNKEQKEVATQVELQPPAKSVDAGMQVCPETCSAAVQAMTDVEVGASGGAFGLTDVPDALAAAEVRILPTAQAASPQSKTGKPAEEHSGLVTEVLMDADRLRAVDLTAHVHALLQARKLDAHCMRALSQLLQNMLHPWEGSLPSESASTSKLKQKSEVARATRPQSESPRHRPGTKEPWRPASRARQPSPPPEELSRSEGVAKKALAQTADVRRLLAEELRKPPRTSRSQLLVCISVSRRIYVTWQLYCQVPRSKPHQAQLRSASRPQKPAERSPFTRKW